MPEMSASVTYVREFAALYSQNNIKTISWQYLSDGTNCFLEKQLSGLILKGLYPLDYFMNTSLVLLLKYLERKKAYSKKVFSFVLIKT